MGACLDVAKCVGITVVCRPPLVYFLDYFWCLRSEIVMLIPGLVGCPWHWFLEVGKQSVVVRFELSAEGRLYSDCESVGLGAGGQSKEVEWGSMKISGGLYIWVVVNHDFKSVGLSILAACEPESSWLKIVHSFHVSILYFSHGYFKPFPHMVDVQQALHYVPYRLASPREGVIFSSLLVRSSTLILRSIYLVQSKSRSLPTYHAVHLISSAYKKWWHSDRGLTVKYGAYVAP